MGIERLVQLAEREAHPRIHRGEMHTFSLYDSDTDIATPKQISFAPASTECNVVFGISASGACKVELMEGVVIGTGGSAAVGTALVPYNRDRNSLLLPLTVVREDYILGSSGQAAGTAILTEYISGATQGALKTGGSARQNMEFILKKNVLTGLRITAIADNTVLSVTMDMYEDEE
jgi:hypothetical protein